MINGTTKCWSETGCSPSEPVFVPRPDAQTEDDGQYVEIRNSYRISLKWHLNWHDYGTSIKILWILYPAHNNYSLEP